MLLQSSLSLKNDGNASNAPAHPLLKQVRIELIRVGSEVTASAKSIERLPATRSPYPSSNSFDARASRKRLILRSTHSSIAWLELPLLLEWRRLRCMLVSITNPCSSHFWMDAALLEELASWFVRTVVKGKFLDRTKVFRLEIAERETSRQARSPVRRKVLSCAG